MTDNAALKKRINFKSGVAETLYKQAGGRCSVPRCTNPTMGPFYTVPGSVNMGIACHIFSAAEDGPRGWGGRDEAFISSEANGLWCCTYHAGLIDKKDGNDYTAAQLFAWKALAEARVRKQMNDTPSPLGWVESIQFTEFVRHLEPPKIELSRSTLLEGPNGAGKTALLQIAAAVSDARHAERFLGSSKPTAVGAPAVRYAAQVMYSTVDALDKTVRLEIANGKLVRREGATLCLLPPGDIEIIYCGDGWGTREDDEDDLDFLMRAVSLDKSALMALATLTRGVVMPGEFSFEHADEDDDDDSGTPPRKKYKVNGRPYIELRFRKEQESFSVTYKGLATSEQSRLVLDILISKAREVAKQRLTLFLVEDLAVSLDASNFQALLTVLANEPFQAVVALPPRHERALLDDVGGRLKLKALPHLEPWKLKTLPPSLKV